MLLNDDDSVKEVLYTSDEFAPCCSFEQPLESEHYKVLMQFDAEYNFVDYDNCPPMEFQARRKSTGDEWWFFSDPIDDFFNT